MYQNTFSIVLWSVWIVVTTELTYRNIFFSIQFLSLIKMIPAYIYQHAFQLPKSQKSRVSHKKYGKYTLHPCVLTLTPLSLSLPHMRFFLVLIFEMHNGYNSKDIWIKSISTKIAYDNPYSIRCNIKRTILYTPFKRAYSICYQMNNNYVYTCHYQRSILLPLNAYIGPYSFIE